eukprot:388258_1
MSLIFLRLSLCRNANILNASYRRNRELTNIATILFTSSGHNENNDNTTQMDAFIQLEIKLAMQKRARQMIENKQTSTNETNNKFEVTTKPQEPSPEECCGKDCPNCVWIDYADKMVKYEEYLHSQK